MRVADAVYGFPAVLSALLITSVFGPGVLISMVAVGIAYVPVFARLTRASVLSLRAQEFVTAARALGARDGADPPAPRPARTRCRRSSCRRRSRSRWRSSPRRPCRTSGSGPSRPIRRGASCCGRRRTSCSSPPGTRSSRGRHRARRARLQPARRRPPGLARPADRASAGQFSGRRRAGRAAESWSTSRYRGQPTMCGAGGRRSNRSRPGLAAPAIILGAAHSPLPAPWGARGRGVTRDARHGRAHPPLPHSALRILR